MDIVTKEAVLHVQNLVKNCPQATDAELRKLLSIQGAVLNQIGIELLTSITLPAKQQKLMRLAFQALHESRQSLKAASDIKVDQSKT